MCDPTIYFAISDSRISIDSNFAIFIVLTLTSDKLRNVLLPVGHYGNTSLNSDVHKPKHQLLNRQGLSNLHQNEIAHQR